MADFAADFAAELLVDFSADFLAGLDLLMPPCVVHFDSSHSYAGLATEE